MKTTVKTRTILGTGTLALLALLAGGCGEGEKATQGDGGAASTTSTRLEVADPPGAVSVYDAKKQEPGTEVAVFGRVGNEVEGQGAFTLVDTTLPYCGEEEAETCPTPWDYCCHPDELPGASLPVEIRDADGGVVALPEDDLRRLDLVALRGRIESTESGGLILIARSGLHRRERPDLADHVRFP